MKAIAGVFLAVILLGWLIVYQPFSSSASYDPELQDEQEETLALVEESEAEVEAEPELEVDGAAAPVEDETEEEAIAEEDAELIDDLPEAPASSNNPAIAAAPGATAAFSNEMLRLVNLVRGKGCKCGNKYMPPAPPLRWNSLLSRAAYTHATDMYKNNFIDHTGHDGSSISDRVSRTGYRWQAVGENIAWNVPTVRRAVIGWRNSPGHCVNMMSKSFREMGAAKKGAYMVQVFGRKMR